MLIMRLSDNTNTSTSHTFRLLHSLQSDATEKKHQDRLMSSGGCPAWLQAVHVDAILIFAFPVQNVELRPLRVAGAGQGTTSRWRLATGLTVCVLAAITCSISARRRQ